jgi:hypothetical protein
VPNAWDPHAVCRAFAQNLATETEQLGRPATGLLIKLRSAFHQPALFYEAPKILLVQANPGQGLHNALQLKQRECGWEQLEDNRAIFELSPESSQRRGEDPPVIQRHRPSQPLLPFFLA